MRALLGLWWLVGFIGAVWLAQEAGDWLSASARRRWVRVVVYAVAGIGFGWLIWGLLVVGTVVK